VGSKNTKEKKKFYLLWNKLKRGKNEPIPKEKPSKLDQIILKSTIFKRGLAILVYGFECLRVELGLNELGVN